MESTESGKNGEIGEEWGQRLLVNGKNGVGGRVGRVGRDGESEIV